MKRHQISSSTRIVATAALACLLALPAVAARAEDKPTPDATFELSEGSVGVGIGYAWGGGTLTYKGNKHKFKVSGLSAGDVGARSVTATGDVYNLKKLEDFNGTYASAQAGATAGGGGGVAIMKNQNGVEIRAKATTQGVGLKLGVEGVKFTLEK
jgi:opacity protein-like surface antigen